MKLYFVEYHNYVQDDGSETLHCFATSPEAALHAFVESGKTDMEGPFTFWGERYPEEDLGQWGAGAIYEVNATDFGSKPLLLIANFYGKTALKHAEKRKARGED